MSKRTLIVFAATFLCFLGALYFLAFYAWERLASEVDRRSAQTAISLVRQRLEIESDYLQALLTDWVNELSRADLALGRNPTIIAPTLLIRWPQQCQPDLAAVVDPRAAIASAARFDQTTGSLLQLDAAQLASLQAQIPDLGTFPKERCQCGIMFVADKVLLACAMPFWASRQQEDHEMVAIFCRNLDEQLANDITQTTGIRLSFFDVGGKSDLPSAPRPVYRSLANDGNAFVWQMTKAGLVAHTLFHDLAGRPTVVVQASLPRGGYPLTAEERMLVLALIVGLIAIGGGLVLFFVYRAQVLRAGRLAQALDEIRLEGDVSRRLSLGGGDELARIAETVNGMLTLLQKSREAHRETQKELAEILEDADDGLIMIDDDCKIINFSRSAEKIFGKKKPDVIGRPLLDILDLPEKEKLRQALQELRSGRAEGGVELEAQVENGRSSRLLKIKLRFAAKGALVFCTDQTESKNLHQQLRIYQRLFDVTPALIVLLDPDGRIQLANPALLRRLGYTDASEIIGRMGADLGGDRDRATAVINKAKTEGSWEGVGALRTKDGQLVDVHGTVCVVNDANGAPIGVLATFTDITERNRAFWALQESEEKYRELLDNLGEGIGVTDLNERFVVVSRVTEEIFGVGPGELVGRSLAEFTSPADFAFCVEQTARRRQGEKGTYEMAIIRPDGQERWIQVTATPRYDKNGKVIGSFGVVQDITERREAEQTLCRSREELALLDKINTAFLTVEGDAVYGTIAEIVRQEVGGHECFITYVDSDGRLCFPTVPAELVPAGEIGTIDDFLADPQGVAFWQALLAAKNDSSMELASPQPINIPIIHQEKVIGNIVIGLPLRAQSQSARRLLELVAVHIAPIIYARLQRDALERQRQSAQQALQQSEEKYRLLIEASPAIIWSQDLQEDKLVAISPAIEKVCGYSVSEFCADYEPWTKVIMPEDAFRWQEHCRRVEVTGEPQNFEIKLLHKDGSTRIVVVSLLPCFDSRGTVVRLHGLALDITDKKLLENQLLQSEKMAAIGILAAGVAHEFNNLLAGIMGNLSLAVSHLDRQQLCRDALQDALKITNQASELVQALLSYSRKRGDLLIDVQVVPLLEGIVRLTHKELKNRAIRLTTDYRDVPPVKGVPDQLQQVFLNILINAIHAVGEGGQISISVWSANDRVFIEFADNGHGIKSEDLGRIFDPFFTTKKGRREQEGRGTGLGLSISHNIVKNHGGEINVKSKWGEGSRFTVVLPVSAAGAFEDFEVDRFFGKRTLLIEFDDQQARLLAGLFGELGMGCVTCKWADEAIDLLQKRSFDFIFIDASHPGMADFVRLVEHLKANHPTLPVFFTSFGPLRYQYTEYLKQVKGVLFKPASPERLMRLLARATAANQTDTVPVSQ